MQTCEHCGSVLSAVTWTCVRGEHCPGAKPRPRGFLFTEAEARELAKENREWTVRCSRTGKWMVWCEASDHYVEF